MNALGYLIRTILKNKILNLRKKPALLILYLIIIGSFVLVCISSSFSDNKANYADIRILYAIVAAIGLFFLLTFVITGLSTGSTLFNMADVGLLFVAPISTKKILVYGLFKQMGTTIFTAVFILYQINSLKEGFGLSGLSVFYIFVIYAVVLFYCQLASIAIYIFTNGNSSRKSLVKGILYGLFTVLLIAVLYIHYTDGGSFLSNVLHLFDIYWFYLVPVGGWAAMFIRGILDVDYMNILLSLFLFFGTGIAIISLFTTGEADYYEDVLNSTEANYVKLQDAKEGKRTVNSSRKVKVKDSETGLRRGKGYKAIFFKHILEKKRSSRLLFVDTYTIIASVGAAIFCRSVNEDFSVYMVLGILVYIQFFLTILGKLSMELSKPFIYMIPAKSIEKVLAASATTLLKPCVDAIIIFTVVCIVSKTSPLLNLFLALAYASSGAIFVSYTLLCERIFGGQPNKLVSSILGFVIFGVVMAPGIGVSVAAVMLLPKSLTFLGTLPFSFCCIVITILVFVICGDLLDKAEYTGK